MSFNPRDWTELEGAWDESIRRATEQPSPWQPIETAPMDGTQVILWRDDEAFSARWVEESAIGPAWVTPDGYMIFRATHWMPLPPPPEQEQD